MIAAFSYLCHNQHKMKIENKKTSPKFKPDYKVLAKNLALVLNLVMFEGMHFDKALEKIMKANKKWGVKDRTLLFETCTGIIRYWRLLATAAEIDKTFKESDFYRIYAAWFIFKNKELPRLPAFKDINTDKIELRLTKYKKISKIWNSYPDWLDDVGRKQYGVLWEKIALALNQEPKMVLRTNTLKTSVQKLQEILLTHRIENNTLTWSPWAVELVYRRNVFRLPEFKEGLFEVQDPVSQMVVHFLNPQPGMRVIDAHAGNGGKTLQLAAFMKNKGRIIAFENQTQHLEELKKRARRAGATIIETKINDSTKTTKRLANSADCLLLDVPCSGLGALRRHPFLKWKLKEKELQELITQQQKSLERFAPTVKSGGRMVYATCSILSTESEDQIKWFLEKYGHDWVLEGEKRYSPAQFDADGYYMALLTKK